MALLQEPVPNRSKKVIVRVSLMFITQGPKLIGINFRRKTMRKWVLIILQIKLFE